MGARHPVRPHDGLAKVSEVDQDGSNGDEDAGENGTFVGPANEAGKRGLYADPTANLREMAEAADERLLAHLLSLAEMEAARAAQEPS